MILLCALIAATALACQSTKTSRETSLIVAAASDLVKAGEPLAEAFERSSGTRITFSFGASGQLEQQIRQGAPFDVYAPAARSYCESLARDGFLDGGCTVYALGRLAAWSANFRLQALAEVAEPRITRIALANPGHAPYGLAARQALQAAGLWEKLQPKLVYADSVAQAFEMVRTDNADVALVALALVAKETAGYRLVLDPSLHAPVEQTVAVLKTSRNRQAAAAFRDFLTGPEGQRILAAYGFGHP